MKNHKAVSLAVLSTVIGCGSAFGQAFPSKPIKMTTVAAGGALDLMARLVAQGIQGPLGQPVIIENRAGQVYPEDGIFTGTPDGYSIGYFANAVWLAPFLRENVPFDPLKDFAHVSLTLKGPNVIAVGASLPVNSVKELVALAKAKPGTLNIGVSPIGTSPTNAAVMFTAMAGINLNVIRYKGTAQSFADLVSGQIQVLTPTILTALPLAKAGKIKVLGVTSGEPSALAPDLPTVASAGLPGYESVAIQAMLAPPKTPAAIVNRLNQEVVKFLRQPDVTAKINAQGFDVVASSPAQLVATMKSEMDKMGPVFKEAGIKPGQAQD